LSQNWFVRAFAIFFVVTMLLGAITFLFIPQAQTPIAGKQSASILSHINNNVLYIAAMANAIILLILADRFKTFLSNRK
jgi:hypothetical protein